MNRPNGAQAIMPLLNWLDGVIQEHGLTLYIVIVNLTPFLIVWILSGGFWRRSPMMHPPPKLRHKSAQAPQPVPPQLAPKSPADFTDSRGEDSFAA